MLCTSKWGLVFLCAHALMISSYCAPTIEFPNDAVGGPTPPPPPASPCPYLTLEVCSSHPCCSWCGNKYSKLGWCDVIPAAITPWQNCSVADAEMHAQCCEFFAAKDMPCKASAHGMFDDCGSATTVKMCNKLSSAGAYECNWENGACVTGVEKIM